MTRLFEIVSTSQRVSRTRSRLQKIDQLATCLRLLDPPDIRIGTAYLAGELPQGRLGIGPALLKGAMPDHASVNPSLTLEHVDTVLTRIGKTSGAGSSLERRQLLGALLADATSEEQQFLARLLLGELRQGALEGVMVEAIAKATQISSSELRRALMVTGDLPLVTETAFIEGGGGLRRFKVQLLKPLLPMLAQSAQDVTEALTQLGSAALEYKLDGARIQVHKQGQDVRIFTRHLNEVTPSVPELVEIIKTLPTNSLILDGEALALRHNGIPQPFQVTMRRFGRKLDVERLRQNLPLVGFYFDCLYLNGQELLDAPGHERFRALTEALPMNAIVPRRVTDSHAEAEAFLREALGQGHEGLMAKAEDAAYAAGSRGSSWLKIKQSHTLDLVVLAAEWGSGRRQGWLSNLHLGARDPQHGRYVMLGKTFKGLTDKMLAWQTERLQAIEIGRDEYTVYVRPELVVEIAFNEVQASAQYPGGFALRFARVKRYRTDKRADEADTIDAVRSIHQQHYRIF